VNKISYKITLLSAKSSWINQYIPGLIESLKGRNHYVSWIHKAEDVLNGDFAFFLSCWEIIPEEVLKRNKHNLVIHESDLPQGKGWSPLTWQILEGKNQIPITLFEATEAVDAGKIYIKDKMQFNGTELIDELRKIQAETSIKMCIDFIDKYPEIIKQGKEQQGDSTFYKRRNPEDSRLNPDKTIREQFNLLRVADNENYPAFFEIDGKKYKLKIERMEQK
jgi:methionyl-tRNA formyltransferase